VIAKLKQQKENSQQSKPVEAVKPVKQDPVPTEEFEDEADEEDEETETPKADAKEQEQIAMEIELLQNNGRFRVELLHQLQEINKALVVVAGIMVDQKNDKA